MRITRKKIIFLVITGIMIIFFMNVHKRNDKTYTVERKKVKIGVIDSYIPEHILKNSSVEYVNYTLLNKDSIDNNHGLITLELINEGYNGNIYYASVLDEENKGSIDNIISAVKWCMYQEVDIICMCFSTISDDERLEDIIKKANENGITIVAACINYSDIKCYPAMYENVISISEGANKEAVLVMPNRDFLVEINGKEEKVKGTSALTAYVSGYIANEFSKSNSSIKDILNKLN